MRRGCGMMKYANRIERWWMWVVLLSERYSTCVTKIHISWHASRYARCSVRSLFACDVSSFGCYSAVCHPKHINSAKLKSNNRATDKRVSRIWTKKNSFEKKEKEKWKTFSIWLPFTPHRNRVRVWWKIICQCIWCAYSNLSQIVLMAERLNNYGRGVERRRRWRHSRKAIPTQWLIDMLDRTPRCFHRKMLLYDFKKKKKKRSTDLLS